MKGKKFVLLLIPVLVLVVLLVYIFGGWQGQEAAFTSENLVFNSGFEIVDNSGKLDSWKEDAKEGWSSDIDGPREGGSSMRASVAWSWFSQEIKVEPERYYLLEAYVRSDITIPEKEDYANTFLTLESLNWRKKVIQTDWGIVNATSSWQLKENLIFTPPGTRRIRIKLAKREGEGSVWFDEIKVMQSSPNLVFNSGFEVLDNSGKPDLWEEDSRGGWSSGIEGAYQGERSMRANVAWSWLSQEVPITPGGYYVLKTYLRSDMTVSEKEDYANTFLTLECLNKEGEVVKIDWGIVHATSSWQLQENAISAPPGTEKIRVKLAKREGEGSVWFDEVELVEVPPSLILNPGFEMLSGWGRAKFWNEHFYGGWSSDTRGSREGERSMRVNVAWSWLSQEIPVRPKTYYTLRAYLRSDITIPEKRDNANTLLTLECLDKENKVLKRVWGITNATLLWQARETVVYTPPETWQIRIKLAKRQGDGFVWFDGLELIRHRYPPHIWGDKPFFIFYFSLYAILVFLLLRMIFKKRVAPKAKKK